jgi:two-component system, OmpR family, alkaline phosphatase synthesis response regulator PhoP
MEKTILLVEDDPFLSDIYSTKFEEVGYVVDVAKNGVSALSKAEEGSYALILLDMVLPKMNGGEVLQQLKKNEKTKAIPVVILSNLGSDEEVKEGLKMGADDYLVKSQFTPSEVVAKINELLSKHG